MSKKNTRVARVDGEIWDSLRNRLPGLSDKEISRLLYNSSAIKLNDELGKILFKNVKQQER